MDEQASNAMMDNAIDTTGSDDFLAGLNATEPQETEPNAQDEMFESEPETEAKPPESEEERKEPDAKEETSEIPKDEDKPVTIEVVYNGEKKSVTLDEARPLIEKGMNYDKIKERYETSPERAIVKKLADQAGKPVNEYIQLLEAKIEEASVMAAAKEVLTKYPDAPQELAKEYGELKAALTAKQNTEAAARAEQEEKERQNKPMQDFIKAYPDIKVEDFPNLPQTVLDAFRNGGDPVRAMKEHEIEQLKAKLQEAEKKADEARKVSEKNTKNRQASVGSLGSDAAQTPNDPFLAGLFG